MREQSFTYFISIIQVITEQVIINQRSSNELEIPVSGCIPAQQIDVGIPWNLNRYIDQLWN